jgi:hypothetical protein
MCWSENGGNSEKFQHGVAKGCKVLRSSAKFLLSVQEVLT